MAKAKEQPVSYELGEVSKDAIMFTPELYSLSHSGIVVVTGNAITWRTGHLEHIANLFTGDPATTERDYADDLAVARAYSADVWEALIAPPQA